MTFLEGFYWEDEDGLDVDGTLNGDGTRISLRAANECDRVWLTPAAARRMAEWLLRAADFAEEGSAY